MEPSLVSLSYLWPLRGACTAVQRRRHTLPKRVVSSAHLRYSIFQSAARPMRLLPFAGKVYCSEIRHQSATIAVAPSPLGHAYTDCPWTSLTLRCVNDRHLLVNNASLGRTCVSLQCRNEAGFIWLRCRPSRTPDPLYLDLQYPPNSQN